MSTRIRRAAGTVAAVALSGCATLFTGTSDDVTFDANVPDVRLSIDGEVQGELPLTVRMSRNFVGGRRFVAKFEKPGYRTQEFEMKREFNTVAILDVSSTLVSGGVDVLTGALLKFSPREYHVQMIETEPGVPYARFQRSLELYRFALTNYRSLQTDVARGGGDHLVAFAWLLCAGDPVASRLIVQRTVDRAPALVGATTAHAFVRDFDRMLADTPALRSYRVDRSDRSGLPAE